jgi:glycosyltransferase involved in cell wall biosynthesis
MGRRGQAYVMGANLIVQEKERSDTRTCQDLPMVSIGMPVYNGAVYIREAIASLITQTYFDFELIISDNASGDETESICRSFAAADPRIRYIRQARNIGATANFEFVLREAKGRFFMWHASDDVSHPSRIGKCVEVLERHEDVAVVSSDVRNIASDRSFLFTSSLSNIRLERAQKHWDEMVCLFFRNPTSNVFFSIYGLYRVDLMRRVSLNYMGIQKLLSQSEIPFLAQVALLGKIISLPDILFTYRRHVESGWAIEQSRLTSRARFSNQLRISYALAQIIARSDVRLLIRIKCLFLIAQDVVAFSARHMMLSLMPSSWVPLARRMRRVLVPF